MAELLWRSTRPINEQSFYPQKIKLSFCNIASKDEWAQAHDDWGKGCPQISEEPNTIIV